jgi:hypothetical protein
MFLLILIVIGMLIYILMYEPKQLGACLDILFSSTKEQIARWYGVTRPTLSKWIDLFTLEGDFPNWNRCKKVQGRQVLKVFVQLGIPFTNVRFTRGRIASRSDDSNTGTVRDQVALNAKKLGFGLDTYDQVTIYPPAVAERIIGIM